MGWSKDEPSFYEVFADAAIECFLSSRPLPDEVSRRVAEALLADNADESDVVAQRCSELRARLAEAVHARLSECTGDADGLDVDTMHRAKVRGSARRRLTSPAFSVGRSPACDVELAGDGSVPPLACLAIAVPSGLLVVDLCVSADSSQEKLQASSSMPSACSPFVVKYGDEAEHRVGAKSIVTFSADLAPARHEESGEKAAEEEDLRMMAGPGPLRARLVPGREIEGRLHDEPMPKCRKLSDGDGLSSASTSFLSFSSSAGSPETRPQPGGPKDENCLGSSEALLQSPI